MDLLAPGLTYKAHKATDHRLAHGGVFYCAVKARALPQRNTMSGVICADTSINDLRRSFT